jgi:hypothetical protein
LPLDRTRSTTSFVDVLDHVLDKGIIIDAWARVSAAGIDLITVEARIVAASISTYLSHAESLSHAWPAFPQTVETVNDRPRPRARARSAQRKRRRGR